MRYKRQRLQRQRQRLRRLTLYVLAVFISSLMPCIATAKTTTAKNKNFLLECDGVSSCKILKPGKQADKRTTHLGFPKAKAKRLLTEVKTSREVLRSKLDAFKTKLELKDRETALYMVQVKQADKTIEVQGRKLVSLEQKNNSLEKTNRELVGKVAKYRGERYKFLIIGFAIGGGIVLAGGVAVGVFLALK